MYLPPIRRPKKVKYMMKLVKILGILAAATAAAYSADSRLELTPSASPVEKITAKRSQIVLNGVWECAPVATFGEALPPAEEWGKILVPGFTFKSNSKPGIVEQKNTPRWKTKAERFWFRRNIDIPEQWNGEIVLRIENVMTGARVFVDGREAGNIIYPAEELDISKFVTAGKTASIALQMGSYFYPPQLLNDKPAQKKNDKKPAFSSMLGISGDVFLLSRPKGAQIDDVFITTSVEHMRLDLDVELRNAKSGDYEVSVKIVDASNGEVAKRFSREFALAGEPKVKLSEKWENPKLWDVNQPNLYFAEISLKKNGKTLDTTKTRFGFREFKIDGKHFSLNGKRVRLIPLHNFFEGDTGGVRQAISNSLDAFKKCNFNAFELWPWKHSATSIQSRKVWAELADEKGILILYPANADSDDFNWNWNDIDARTKWTDRFIRQWREIRNNPSVIALMTLPNTYPNNAAANPMNLGNSLRYRMVEDLLPTLNYSNPAQGKRLVATMKMFDQTRPVSGHHSCTTGDFHSINHYIDFVPLQEREEWLSNWAKNGNVPFCAIEFGTPFFGNFVRDRKNPYSSYTSEPLLTEFVAPYLGAAAYKNESDAYRKMVSDGYIEAKKEWKPMNEADEFRFADNMADFQALFNKNTWRSWRAWGIPGGMVPWRDAYGWVPEYGMIDLPFKHGALGWQPPKVSKRGFYGMAEGGAKPNASGRALIENQKHALAWIGGKPEAFTDKAHHFYGGDKVEKTAVITNDLREDAKYSLEWTATLDGKKIASGKLDGVVPVGKTAFVPFSFDVPKADKKTLGEIEIKGGVGGIENADKFAFTVYPQTKFPRTTVKVFDPQRKTSKALNALGILTVPWDGKCDGGLLILCENAYAKKLPANIVEFAEKGGSVLILPQPEEILEQLRGFRTSKFVSRRVFPVLTMQDHPFIAGFDSEDFRDWRGAGTFAPETATTEIIGDKRPLYGWHWGNRGSVASQSLEKPHRAGWTPILECEFDLAYSPLMERKIGRGVVVFCGLDLLGRTEADPVADAVLSRIISNLADREPAADDVKTYYIGGKRGAELLGKIGVEFVETAELPKSGLVVVGEGSKLSDDAIKAAMDGGANFLLIERNPAAKRFGIAQKDGTTNKVLDIPNWNELRGLSWSDVRTRANIPAKVFDTKDTCGGTMAVFRSGKGSAVMFSLLPDELDTAGKTYLRYTAWRMYRTLSQVAANFGAKFKYDKVLMAGGVPQMEISLSKTPWRFATVSQLNGKHPESEKFDDSAWLNYSFPDNCDEFGNPVYPFPKPYWVRKTVFIPKNWSKDKIVLEVGRIVGQDDTYFNGVKVGGYDGDPWKGWLVDRKYDIPENLIKFGEDNVISVLVKQPVSTGRITGMLKLTRGKPDNLYMLDYIDDILVGDNPFRYMGW